MPIYTDGTHLVGDTLEELHEFAKRLGFKRHWFQEHARHPHYDLTTNGALRRALEKGAKLIAAQEVIRICERAIAEPKNEKSHS